MGKKLLAAWAKDMSDLSSVLKSIYRPTKLEKDLWSTGGNGKQANLTKPGEAGGGDGLVYDKWHCCGPGTLEEENFILSISLVLPNILKIH